MADEIELFSGERNPNPGICNHVLITLRAEIALVRSGLDTIKERVLENEERHGEWQGDFHTNVDGLRDRIRQDHDRLKDLISAQHKSFETLIHSHAAEDNRAMQEIREQLLARVPAWALALITVGGALIGSMGTYILDRLPK